MKPKLNFKKNEKGDVQALATNLKNWMNIDLEDLANIIGQLRIKGDELEVSIAAFRNDSVHLKVSNGAREYSVIVERGNMISPYSGFSKHDGKFMYCYHWDNDKKKLTLVHKYKLKDISKFFMD